MITISQDLQEKIVRVLREGRGYAIFILMRIKGAQRSSLSSYLYVGSPKITSKIQATDSLCSI